jgi:Cd2+/Zn2+-exporting ATPase
MGSGMENSTAIKSTDCLIEEVARVMVQYPDLKAVTLDAEKQRISFALQGGSATASETQRYDQLQSNLESLIKLYSGERAPACVLGRTRVDCGACETAAHLQLPRGIRVVPLPGSVLIEKETCATAPHFWKWSQFDWLQLGTRASSTVHDHHHHHEDWRKLLGMALGCGVATIAGFVFAATGHVNWSQLAYAVAYLLGAWHPAGEVISLLRRRILDIHFLMLAVAAGAAFIGHWPEGAILLFLFSFSGALEGMAMERTEREISSLYKAAPKEAISLEENGKEAAVPVERLSKGMLFRVRPGEQFAVDGVIVDGDSAADESNLNGESTPIDKKPGDYVLAGTLNLWGRVDCRVLRASRDSALSKIIDLIHEAQAAKAPSQRFTDRFGSGYTLAILGLSTAMFFIWWLGFGLAAFEAAEGVRSAFYNTMTLLVVASPCALVLSIPSAILAGIAAGARRGVLFRGGAAIEKLADIDRVALDKTGTLTTGILSVQGVQSDPPGREDEVLRLAAALGQNSAHPVSRAIVRAASEKKLEIPAAPEFRSLTGQGLGGKIRLSANRADEQQKAQLGRRTLFPDNAWMKSRPEPEPGVTEVMLECGPLRGRILLQDQVRVASRPLLEKLGARGLAVTMLTGDREEAAKSIATQVGLKDFRAGLHPEDKVNCIREWTRSGEKVAMVGDGVNDAPSLAAAYVGVAMGVRGSDAAMEQADIILMQDRLENFYHAWRLSQRTRRIIRQNLVISLGVIAVLVAGALGAAIPLTVGVFGHEGSTVLVVLNSLRLLLPDRA